MKRKVNIGIIAALSVVLWGCGAKKATTPVPAAGTGSVSGLVLSLDGVEVAAAAGSPWLPAGPAQVWVNEVPVAISGVATALQQSNPFAQADQYIATLKKIESDAAALGALDGNAAKAVASIIAAVNQFMTLYAQQAGIQLPSAAAPKARAARAAVPRWQPTPGDLVELKVLSARKTLLN